MIPFLEESEINVKQKAIKTNRQLANKTHLNTQNVSIREILSRSTMHGLPRVINSKMLVLKFSWLFFLITSVFLFGKFSYDSIFNYLEYEVTTKIRKIHESPTIFPTVTICNKNKMTTDFGIDTIKKTINFYKYPDLFNLTVLTNMTLEERYRDSDNAIFRAGNAVTDFSVEDKKKLGHLIDDFLIECKFDDVFCNVSKDFVWFFDNIYGNCYKYNSGFNSNGEPVELIKSSQPGKYYLGLKLVLFESMPEILERISYSGIGFVVKVDNHSFTVDGNSKIELLSGVETNIAVDRISQTQLSFPYSDCFIDDLLYHKEYKSELFEKFVKSKISYKQKDCLELCQQKFYVLHCKCMLIQYFSLYNETICNTIEQMDCAYGIYFNIINKPGFFEESCYQLCPLECSTTEFNSFLTINSFSKEIYLDVVKSKQNFVSKYDNKTLSDEKILNKITKVNIYYETLSRTTLTESVSLNGVSLLASIGGFMGMFLGMSLMTLVEFFEIFFRILFYFKR